MRPKPIAYTDKETAFALKTVYAFECIICHEKWEALVEFWKAKSNHSFVNLSSGREMKTWNVK